MVYVKYFLSHLTSKKLFVIVMALQANSIMMSET